MSTLISKINERLSLLKKLKKEVDILLDQEEGNNLKEEKRSRFLLEKHSLKEIKMAVIMDPFTLACYKPECQILELLPDQWEEQIVAFIPDLIFIESAWQGKDKTWYRKIDRCSKEYFEMTSYCQKKGIPIVFWNKEDPVYTDSFMAAARMADYVFTTDIDCISKYKMELGHERVYHLHFAAQPKLHNPIEKYERKDRFCFAGAYYHRYPKRAEVFDRFSDIFIETKGLDIYDRNYQNALPEHAFPKQYTPYILGRLEPQDIDVAYKGYYYGINMNSINQSQTMFARRVFELLASNTITVGNYSRGLKNYFGDLTVCTDDPETLSEYLQKYCADPQKMNKYRLAGLRKVLQDHLYEDRLDYVIQKVFGVSLKPKTPPVYVISKVDCREEYEQVYQCFKQQTYKRKRFLLITELKIEVQDETITVLSKKEAQEKRITDFGGGIYISLFDPRDYYGPNYLLDLVLTLRYADFKGVGKKLGKTYAETESLNIRQGIFSAELFVEKQIWDFLTQKQERKGSFFCTDSFNYVEDVKNKLKETEYAQDLMIADQGIALSKIQKIAENIICPIETISSDRKFLGQEDLIKIKIPKESPIRIQPEAEKIKVICELPAGKHEYLYLDEIIDIEQFKKKEGLPVKYSGVGELDFICVCVFLDKNKKNIEPAYPPINRLQILKVPADAHYVKLGFRVKGAGEYLVSGITLGDCPEKRKIFLPRSQVLVLTNQYPSPQELYRNMFVHKRMEAYKEAGFVCDVMKMNIYAKEGYREFNGINVVEGRGEVLSTVLDCGQINTVCVHFLDELMWQVLKNYDVRIIVWVHGAEIQPWWRRKYNYTSERELEEAKRISQKRYEFWQGIFNNLDKYNLHFVFVSQYFANTIFEDYNIQLNQDQYSIIHNYIDANMFIYEKKKAEQRKRILSIRPYASRTYANDLSVKCIQKLAREPFFKDLEFYMIGDGALFEETLKPLRKYSNIKIEKKFMRQIEISQLHKEYGVFLTPTRMDSQGVSRDEAMASGLVPVTNAVAAIPEFVDETCGILAQGEDYLSMAQGIEKLYRQPEMFLAMSHNSAQRVRQQSGKSQTIGRELNLIIK